MTTAIIIPALNPGRKLEELIRRLQKISDSPIVLVDDGSGGEARELLARLDDGVHCFTVRHPSNLGKGAALKTGIRFALETFPELSGFITADADGQHRAEDIIRVKNDLLLNPDAVILGVRDLNAPQVPFKSRWGNRITSWVFERCTHVRCGDTQTGLRGFPASRAAFCLSAAGNRYEYEMNVLLAAAKSGLTILSLPISTVYENENKGSHFHPVRDSALIYGSIFAPFLRFGASSLLCAGADLSAFTLFASIGTLGVSTAGILFSTVSARLLAGALNFMLNKRWSFSNREKSAPQALVYAGLFSAQLLTSWLMVSALSVLPVSITLVKAMVDCFLFSGSYLVQKNLIFKPGILQKADA